MASGGSRTAAGTSALLTKGFRFLLGPWRWLLIVYVFIEPENRVVAVTIQDARSSTAATVVRG